MKLGVNVVRLTREFTGVGRYIECLLSEWAAMTLPFDEVVLYAPKSLRHDLAVFPRDRYRIKIIDSALPDPLWEWSFLGAAAAGCDVLFCPSYTMPIGFRGRCAVTYHGPAIFPRWGLTRVRGMIYESLARYAVRHADLVFAVSHSVKRRVVDIYRVPENKVIVTYLAASDLFRPVGDTVSKADVRRHYLGSGEPFILFVGKMSGRHFVPQLLDAFAAAARRSQLPHRLLLVGPDVLGLSVKDRARRMGFGDRITHIPFVKHAELPALYSAAEIFIFPASDAEGFGLPVLEAMACGTPVISTNRGSIAEFARDAALLVGTSTTGEMAQAIERLAQDPVLRDNLRRSGLEKSKQMRWRKTAEETMQSLWETATRDRQHALSV